MLFFETGLVPPHMRPKRWVPPKEPESQPAPASETVAPDPAPAEPPPSPAVSAPERPHVPFRLRWTRCPIGRCKRRRRCVTPNSRGCPLAEPVEDGAWRHELLVALRDLEMAEQKEAEDVDGGAFGHPRRGRR